MGRATAVAVLALLSVWCVPAHAAEKPLLVKPVIPPALAELEAKADALQFTSARSSISFTLNVSKAPKGLRAFLKLFEFKVEGVETTSPPAGAFTLTLFGSHVRLRYVEGHTYLFSWELGLKDGGRPWIELGHGALGRAFGGSGKSTVPQTTSGAARWSKIFTLVNNGTGIQELPATTLYGQPVTGFGEEVEPQAGGEASGDVSGFAAAKRPAPRRSEAEPKPKLSIYFAASGAPVRVQVLTGTAKAGATLTADYPAIDFPYTIPPIPPSHVITEAKLLKRSRPHQRSSVGGNQPPSESSHAEGVTPGHRS